MRTLACVGRCSAWLPALPHANCLARSDLGPQRPPGGHNVVWVRPAIASYFVIVYFIIGVLFYTQQMDWDVDFTLYFIVVIITTVGYGDHEDIETDGQKL